ncbi:MAG: LPO_1073/Vpar_1526 family protein, partial [Campylobacterota bacterium]|nr:LPO_1073/Vpar_1526 family protein [Campylobacterota bacterium]
MIQKATVEENSTSIQVTGDFSMGLTFESCERLFNLLLLENMPKLEAIAKQKAIENVNKLVDLTYKKLDDRIENIEIKKMSEPDVQSTFNIAVQGVAKKGEKIDIDLLADLLQSRLENDNDDYIDNCIESAVEIIPKLTNELLYIIPV